MSDPVEKRTVAWYDLDRVVPGLETDMVHEIRVQREAIPLVFLPGIMGTNLRKAGTDGKGKGPDRLPNLRWNPGDKIWMIRNYSGESPEHRKAMLVGDVFSPDFLEVANDTPVGDGFSGILDKYWKKFLKPLKERDWGPLAEIFDFPVYAVGYNWTDSNQNSGKKLADRVQEIIDEAKGITGMCERVILITHSMGGLVSRWATQMAGAQGKVLGIVHAVQPVLGAPAAYWRMKAGFEAKGWLDLPGKAMSRVLGNNGPCVTAVLANVPGGLQLLPNKLFTASDGGQAWLNVTGIDNPLSLPVSDPYSEIYEIPAVVKPAPGEQPSTNRYWGLVDPDLLDPGNASSTPAGAPDSNDNNSLDADAPPAGAPWSQYRRLLDLARQFHDDLGIKAHPKTFSAHGFGGMTADGIELQAESKWMPGPGESYPKREFRGFFTDASGNMMQAVLQDPAGDGDWTVPLSSSTALDDIDKEPPGDAGFEVEHQGAYEDTELQKYAIEAIMALCKHWYEERRGPIGDFDTESADGATA